MKTMQNKLNRRNTKSKFSNLYFISLIEFSSVYIRGIRGSEMNFIKI